MKNRPFLSLTASILAASSFLAACDPGEDPDPGNPDGGGAGCDLWYPDVDGDNHGDENSEGLVSCIPVPDHARANDDCDDTSEHVNPDQHELCDGIDNDCDGQVESAGVCPAGCTALQRGTPAALYMVCGGASWTQARTRCVEHGMDLVHVNDDAENTFVVEKALAAYPSAGHVWLGATDAASEGVWAWADDATLFWTGAALGVGEPGVFEKWAHPAEPNNGSAMNEHCMHVYTGTRLWNDWTCNQTLVSMCERPRD